MTAPKRRGAFSWAATGALLLAALSARWTVARRGQRQNLPPEVRAVMLRDPAKVPTVTLVDQHGASLTSDALFAGRWSFLFLGFASCPTVCPATLSQLATLKRSLARQFPGTPQPRYVFVSVDPGRDPPARLASYLATFDGDFLGATGAPAALASLSDALTAFHRLESPTAAGDYGVVHSGEIYLMDPSGRVYARFTPPLDTASIPRLLVSMMASYAADGNRS